MSMQLLLKTRYKIAYETVMHYSMLANKCPNTYIPIKV